MKKYVTKLFSLLMAVCMVGSLLAPSALAVNAANNAEIDGGVVDWARIPVSSGVRVGVRNIFLYPARYDADTKGFLTNSNVYLTASYPVDERWEALHVSPEKTQAILTKFKEKTGMEANAWSVTASFTIFTDGKGSYGKYFQFNTSGNCLDGKTLRFDVSRSTTTFTPPPITVRFLMPENTSIQYLIGFSGGCYYYSAAAKKEIGTATGAEVYLNSAYNI